MTHTYTGAFGAGVAGDFVALSRGPRWVYVLQCVAVAGDFVALSRGPRWVYVLQCVAVF